MEKTNIYNDKWLSNYQKLVAFKEKHGHLFVPYLEGEDRKRNKLHSWISVQRIRLKQNIMPDHQIALLDQIGFHRSASSLTKSDHQRRLIQAPSAKWLSSYQELVAFKEKYGNILVPYKKSQQIKLSRWIIVQRIRIKQKKLSSQQIDLLNKIGLSQPGIPQRWMRRYNDFLAFKEKHGHANITLANTESKELYDWVWKQRDIFSQKKLSTDKIQLLNEAGFIWSIFSMRWLESYQALLEFKQEHGHTNCSRGKNKKLNTWLVSQRMKIKSNKLSKEKVDLLYSTGWL